jgi:hypothetical protein
MGERNPIPDCLSHLRQLLPVRTAGDDHLIRELRSIAEYELPDKGYEIVVIDAANRIEGLLRDG